MPSKTKVLSVDQIIYIVEKTKKGHAIRIDSINFDRVKENPAFKALSEVEQSIYLMFLGGMMHKDIAQALNLTRCQVTRLLNIAKGKIRYLLNFRGELMNNPEYLKKFYLMEDDGFGPRQPFNLRTR
ncbi:MAG: hypothetical protein J6Z11_03920 [Candidatus Riflebacteria bacterium]|nr:hypothetical protein [Candidatus Riflebacteria bacterium]